MALIYLDDGECLKLLRVLEEQLAYAERDLGYIDIDLERIYKAVRDEAPADG